MNARLAIIITTLAIATVAVVPSALATDAQIPVPLAPGEKVISHTSSSVNDSRYVIELLSAIQGVKIGADKTTVVITNGKTTHPIEIEYGSALKETFGTSKASAQTAGTGAGGAGTAGAGSAAAGAAGAASTSSGGGIGIGQIAAVLLGLTVLSRVIGIIRQLGGGRR